MLKPSLTAFCFVIAPFEIVSAADNCKNTSDTLMVSETTFEDITFTVKRSSGPKKFHEVAFSSGQIVYYDYESKCWAGRTGSSQKTVCLKKNLDGKTEFDLRDHSKNNKPVVAKVQFSDRSGYFFLHSVRRIERPDERYDRDRLKNYLKIKAYSTEMGASEALHGTLELHSYNSTEIYSNRYVRGQYTSYPNDEELYDTLTFDSPNEKDHVQDLTGYHYVANNCKSVHRTISPTGHNDRSLATVRHIRTGSRR